MNDDNKKSLKDFVCRIRLFEWLTRQFSSNTPNKLVFLNTSIRTLLFMALCWLPIIFVGFQMTFDLISSLNRLNQASLNCIRDKGEISCSLTGTDSFGNIEQVLSPRRERLIAVKMEISNADSATDGFIVLVTDKKEIVLFTQKSIIKDQTDQLNSFLSNPIQDAVKIQTRRWHEHDISLNRFFPFFWFCACLLISLKIIFDIKKYIFDKENNRITIKRIWRKDLYLEIELQTIKKLILESHHEESKEKILLIGDKDSILLSIDISLVLIGSKIAYSICSFLKLEPYQEININTEELEQNIKVLVVPPISSPSEFISYSHSNTKLGICSPKTIFLLKAIIILITFNVIIIPLNIFSVFMIIPITLAIFSLIIIFLLKEKLYIFEKHFTRLYIVSCLSNKLIFEISLQKINRIYLNKIHIEELNNFQIYRKFTTYNVEIFDQDDSLLLSINHNDQILINAQAVAHEIANSICYFLSIPPYQTNDDITIKKSL